jgi:hypothetical protein
MAPGLPTQKGLLPHEDPRLGETPLGGAPPRRLTEGSMGRLAAICSDERGIETLEWLAIAVLLLAVAHSPSTRRRSRAGS